MKGGSKLSLTAAWIIMWLISIGSKNIAMSGNWWESKGYLIHQLSDAFSVTGASLAL